MLEKEAVLKKMKEQQKQACSCTVCGRRRNDIESQLEFLYNSYYQELENFANVQVASPDVYRPHPHLSHHKHHQHGISQGKDTTNGTKKYPDMPALISDDSMDEFDDELSDEDDQSVPSSSSYSDKGGDSGIVEFGTSLTVQGGILTVADDFLKNDGRKFLDLMEQLAQRKISPNRPAQMDDDDSGSENGDGWDDYDEGSNSEDYDEDEENHYSDQQRVEESRRMFQIFAAKMFEQRVLTAYQEKVTLNFKFFRLPLTAPRN